MTIEPRPKLLTSEMAMSAARRIARRLAESRLIAEEDADGCAADIAECARRDMDGYEIARDLEGTCDWNCTLQIAEELDRFSDEARREIKGAEKEWAERNGPTPPFSIGTRVRFAPDKTGMITGIDEYGVARFLVAVDGEADTPTGKSRRIVNFEDAHAIEGEASNG